MMLVALPKGHRADLVADALVAKITTLPAALTRTLTWDQGNDMAAHARFTDQTGIEVYFCDPKSLWQRGSNENYVSRDRQRTSWIRHPASGRRRGVEEFGRFADARTQLTGNERDLMELAGRRWRRMLTRRATATRAERARDAGRL